MPYYNVIIIFEGGYEQAMAKKPLFQRKMAPGSVQELFWNDTRNLPMKGW
jgi:hypothetical protein